MLDICGQLCTQSLCHRGHHRPTLALPGLLTRAIFGSSARAQSGGCPEPYLGSRMIMLCLLCALLARHPLLCILGSCDLVISSVVCLLLDGCCWFACHSRPALSHLFGTFPPGWKCCARTFLEFVLVSGCVCVLESVRFVRLVTEGHFSKKINWMEHNLMVIIVNF